MTQPQLYLASNSPRRLQLLNQLGLSVIKINADIDETPFPQEKAVDYVLRMAEQKNIAAQAVFAQMPSVLPLPLLTADTIVVLEQQILGKPQTELHAQQMLQALSGRSHQVLTALCLSWQGQRKSLLQSSEVWFKPLTAEEIKAYIASGEPMDKAGAYGIQGLGGIFVERIQGSFSGIMGLPVFETAQLLQAAGINVIG